MPCTAAASNRRTANDKKNDGVLIGAVTSTLADGELSKNVAPAVHWPNGYVLTINMQGMVIELHAQP